MTDAVVPSGVGSPEHFIQQLPFEYEITAPGRMVLAAETRHPDDVGLLATLVDVVGGVVTLNERPRSMVPTTSIELFGLEQLDRPGRLTCEATLVHLGRRRASIEVAISIESRTAWSRIDFFVLEDRERPSVAAPRRRTKPDGAVIDTRLCDHIGARTTEGGATVEIVPRVHNTAAALQGGATMSLLETAARTAMDPNEVFTAASVCYLRQVAGRRAVARVRSRRANVIVADVYADASERAGATATFQVDRSA